MVMVPSKFEQLPDEILLMIFVYLTTEQAYGLFHNLNQRFKRALREIDHAIDLTQYTLAEFEQFSMAENLPIHRVVALHLTGDDDQSTIASLLTDVCLSNYDLSQFSHLKSLTIDSLTVPLFFKLVSLRSLPRLTTLSLCGTSSSPKPPEGLFFLFFSWGATRFPQLQKLAFNFDFETTCQSDSRAIREGPTLPFLEITKQLPSITCLTIKDRLRVVDLAHILRFLPNLQHLSTSLSMHPDLYACNHLSNLTSLELDVIAVQLLMMDGHMFLMFPRLHRSLVIEMSLAPDARNNIGRGRLQVFFDYLSDKLDQFRIHIKHGDRCDGNEFYFQEYETKKHWIKFETVELHNQYYGESCGTIFHSVMRTHE